MCAQYATSDRHRDSASTSVLGISAVSARDHHRRRPQSGTFYVNVASYAPSGVTVVAFGRAVGAVRRPWPGWRLRSETGDSGLDRKLDASTRIRRSEPSPWMQYLPCIDTSIRRSNVQTFTTPCSMSDLQCTPLVTASSNFGCCMWLLDADDVSRPLCHPDSELQCHRGVAALENHTFVYLFCDF